jgi:hypothetical protein
LARADKWFNCWWDALNLTFSWTQLGVNGDQNIR